MAIGDVPHDAGPDALLQPETKKALQWVKERVVHGPPRVATLKERSRAFFYTDGACEPGPEGSLPKCSFGGAIFAGSTKLHFGMEIPEDIARPWLARAGKEQMVFECEMLPYLAGLALAPGAFKHRDLLVFVDNEAARKTFVKAFTRSEEGSVILDSALPLEEELDVRAFFCRVPTHSNLAGGPSRLSFEEVEKMGCKRIHISKKWLARALNVVH